jgi:hypothetical protein
MKVNIPGKTPMERLTNLTKRVLAVPKSEIAAASKKPRSKQRRRALAR